MATIHATITFALPEDQDADILHLYASQTEGGVYSLVHTSRYDYGKTEAKIDLDDTYWYKLQFENSDNGRTGPYSDPVFGGTFEASAPFLAISTRTDGANYATTQDVYEYSGLTPSDIDSERVSTALRRARALIDYRTAEMGLDRFEVFNTDTARRKYNASLRILKEAEINIALGNIYTNLSDDQILQSMRGSGGTQAGSISIGGTTVGGDSLAERNESILFLAALADKYFIVGERLLSALDTNSVKLVPNDYSVRIPRFRYPFNGR